jgi:hypothetical protein
MTEFTASVCFVVAMGFAGMAMQYGSELFGFLAALILVAGGMLLIEEKT